MEDGIGESPYPLWAFRLLLLVLLPLMVFEVALGALGMAWYHGLFQAWQDGWNQSFTEWKRLWKNGGAE
jgi:hypothetical protein